MKFKIGDKVRILKYSEYRKFLKSKLFEIEIEYSVVISDNFHFDVQFISNNKLWGLKGLKIIEPSPYKDNFIMKDENGNFFEINHFLITHDFLTKKLNKLLNI